MEKEKLTGILLMFRYKDIDIEEAEKRILLLFGVSGNDKKEMNQEDWNDIANGRDENKKDGEVAVCSCGKRKSYNKREKWWCWYCNGLKKKQTDH